MSRKLDDLSSALRPKAFELLARLTERGVQVMIVDTLRTEAEHQQNLKNGTSAAKYSRHLPRKLRTVCAPSDPDAEKSDAMDVCPYELYALHGPDKLRWETSDAAWKVIGDEARKLGLVWGGLWKTPFDPGHVELPRAEWANE
jgi:hypothetical protein